MKKWIVYLVFIFTSLHVHAQKKKSTTLIGFHVGQGNSTMNPKSNFLKYKIGLPSFSYAASIEQRLQIKNKFSFSLQYSVHYFSLSKRMLNSVILNKKGISNSIGIHSNFQVTKKTVINAGFGVNKSIYSQNKSMGTSYESSTRINENKFTIQDFNQFNPYFLIGIENGIQLLSKNLYYSLQYNFGFNSLQLQKNPNDASSLNEFRIGLKYKY